jgi:hypothetical protein
MMRSHLHKDDPARRDGGEQIRGNTLAFRQRLKRLTQVVRDRYRRASSCPNPQIGYSS